MITAPRHHESFLDPARGLRLADEIDAEQVWRDFEAAVLDPHVRPARGEYEEPQALRDLLDALQGREDPLIDILLEEERRLEFVENDGDEPLEDAA